MRAARGYSKRNSSQDFHMTIETQDDVVALKRIGKIVSLILQQMLDAAEPGMTTRELDLLGERMLEEHGARSAPKLTYNFPGQPASASMKKRHTAFLGTASSGSETFSTSMCRQNWAGTSPLPAEPR